MKPPATLDDCVHLVVSSLGEDQAEQIRSLDEKDLSMLHFGLGLWIRNTIIHPRTPFMKSLEASAVFIHPDTVSTLIVEAVWAYLRTGEVDARKLVSRHIGDQTLDEVVRAVATS